MSAARADRNAEVQVALTQPGAGVGAGVAIVVLSHDAALLDALDQVVTSDHAINIVATEDALATSILAAHCGVAVIDAEASGSSVDHLAARLRAQFPDLVLIVAGRDTHQSSLSGLITTGVIYRFLHKPVSSQRVRLFVDAALRRHDEEHAGAAQLTVRKPAVAAATGGARRKPALLVGGIAALLVVAALAYFMGGRGGSAKSPATGAAAMAAATASADAKLNNLLADTEQALVQGRIFDAAASLEQARQLQPDNIRVAFLTGQLSKERERSMLTRARAAAASGDFNQALAALDGPSASNNNSSTLAETRRDLERQQIDDRVRLLLRQGNEYVQRGAIAVPEGANAVFQLEAARTLAPRDPGVARLELAINARIIAEARSAATRGDAAGTTNWLKLGSERRLPAAQIEAIRGALASAQGSARSAELVRLTTSVNDLIARGRNDDATLDAAHTALAALRSHENNGPNTRDAQERLAVVMLAHARNLVDAGRLDEAQKALADAQSLGAAVDAAAAVSTALGAQRERVRVNTDIVGANKLKRLKSPEPIYPSTALAANKQGWVDVVFLIRSDGSVTDTQVQAAEPAGVFDKAATDCLKRWRFEPVLRDGKAVEQRARLRVRFSIDK